MSKSDIKTNFSNKEYKFDMDDKRFRIKPYQQIMSSCSGALITSLFSKYETVRNWDLGIEFLLMVEFFLITVTPLDVVKTRLQAQQKVLASNRCFVYCNGLMDHLCPCPNGLQAFLTSNKPTRYTGMMVNRIVLMDHLIKINMLLFVSGRFL